MRVSGQLQHRVTPTNCVGKSTVSLIGDFPSGLFTMPYRMHRPAAVFGTILKSPWLATTYHHFQGVATPLSTLDTGVMWEFSGPFSELRRN
jgi:hypothetical protein